MMISIVLSTYNGARFVEQQLESLKGQTLQPDEVLIFDDGSSDGTAERIEGYLLRHALRQYRLHRNAENLGWQKNFWQGFAAACGDIIMPCDQDDVWHPVKIERMAETLCQRPETQLLSCDYRAFYEGNPVMISSRLQGEAQGSGLIEPNAFPRDFMIVRRPGCSFAFRRQFFQRISAYWREGVPHDLFLWSAAVLLDASETLHEVLFDFRRHAGSVTNVHHRKERPWRERVQDEIKDSRATCRFSLDCLEGLMDLARDEAVDRSRRETLDSLFRYHLARSNAYDKRSLPKYIKGMIRSGMLPPKNQALRDVFNIACSRLFPG